MRTTLDLDLVALEAARQLALHKGQSLGKAVSELILQGLSARANTPARRKDALPVFRAGTRPITLQDVKAAEEDE
ncbi:MAG: hypothetical protein ABIN37_13705 [Burkholderiaceae bacterium]